MDRYNIICPRFTGSEGAEVLVDSSLTILETPRYWRSFEGDNLKKLTGWLERTFDEVEVEHLGVAAHGNRHDVRTGAVAPTEQYLPGKSAVVDNGNDGPPVVWDDVEPDVPLMLAPVAQTQQTQQPQQTHQRTGSASAAAEFPCSAIMGPAGSGKSTQLRERAASDPHYAICAATTGVAAINLGPNVTTIHSLLRFYDLHDAQMKAHRGIIVKAILDVARAGFKHINIDEMSMLGAELFQLIHDETARANKAISDGWVTFTDADGCETQVTEPVGLILTGDFLQLPPVKDRYAFQAPCWQHYAPHVTKLETIYRQTNPVFLSALADARRGAGAAAGIKLKRAGVEFASKVDDDFKGVTMFPTNASVDKFNREALAKLPGDEIVLHSASWGKQAPEWDAIPAELVLKYGALVMLLANNHDAGYVNGDLAAVISEPDKIAATSRVTVQLLRNAAIHEIDYIVRENVSYDKGDSLEEDFKHGHADLWRAWKNNGPSDPVTFAKWMEYKESKVMGQEPYYDLHREGTIVGEIEYLPMRIGYSCTFHKAQGLTLDKVQICCDNKFASMPGAMYTALTRCIGPEGMRIVVNDIGRFARRVITSPLVKAWV